eukprot:jgi/Mesvir1/6452/Mv19532-RA.1
MSSSYKALRDFRYFVVTDEQLAIVQKSGNAPTVEYIAFENVDSVVREREGISYMADEGLAQRSQRIIISHTRLLQYEEIEEFRKLSQLESAKGRGGVVKWMGAGSRRSSRMISRHSSRDNLEINPAELAATLAAKGARDGPEGKGHGKAVKSRGGSPEPRKEADRDRWGEGLVQDTVLAGRVRRNSGDLEEVVSDLEFEDAVGNVWKQLYDGSYVCQSRTAIVAMETHSQLFFHCWRSWIECKMRSVAPVQHHWAGDVRLITSPTSPHAGRTSITASSWSTSAAAAAAGQGAGNKDGAFAVRELFTDLEERIMHGAVLSRGMMSAIEELGSAGETSVLIKRLFFKSEPLIKFFMDEIDQWSALAASPRPVLREPPGLRSMRDHRRRQRQHGGYSSANSSGSGSGLYQVDNVGLWEYLLRRLVHHKAGRYVIALMNCLQKLFMNSEAIQARLNMFFYRSPYSLEDLVGMCFTLAKMGLPDPDAEELAAGDADTALLGAKVVEVLAYLLHDLDGLFEQGALEGIIPEKLVLSRVIRKCPMSVVKGRLMQMFSAAINQISLPALALDGLKLFMLLRAVLMITEGIKGITQFLAEEYEEELKYVLGNPDMDRKLRNAGRQDFFVEQSRLMVHEVVSRCHRAEKLSRHTDHN